MGRYATKGLVERLVAGALVAGATGQFSLKPFLEKLINLL
jgi:hypothetical protein